MEDKVCYGKMEKAKCDDNVCGDVMAASGSKASAPSIDTPRQSDRHTQTIRQSDRQTH